MCSGRNGFGRMYGCMARVTRCTARAKCWRHGCCCGTNGDSCGRKHPSANWRYSARTSSRTCASASSSPCSTRARNSSARWRIRCLPRRTARGKPACTMAAARLPKRAGRWRQLPRGTADSTSRLGRKTRAYPATRTARLKWRQGSISPCATTTMCLRRMRSGGLRRPSTRTIQTCSTPMRIS